MCCRTTSTRRTTTSHKALKIDRTNASALVGRGVVKSRKGQPTDGSADIAVAVQLEAAIVDDIKKLGIGNRRPVLPLLGSWAIPA